MTEKQFYKIYRRKFLIAYANFVALSNRKSEQILVEESNILSHLAQYQNPALSPVKQQDNLNKAGSHLIRATLDLQKMIWFYLAEFFKIYLEKSSRFLLCFNMRESEVLAQYARFMDLAKSARTAEMTDIGVNPLRSIARYEIANDLGFKLFNSFDKNKKAKVDGLFAAFKTKEVGISFVTGVATGLIGNYCFSLLSPGTAGAKILSFFSKDRFRA